MSKIFCEICGTAYSNTASQCPICGCPRPASAEFSVDSAAQEETKSRTAPVKGGRFSKDNVNKRLNNDTSRPEPPVAPRKPTKKKKKSSTAERVLVIAIICLLVAIVGVLAYIILNYFVPGKTPDSTVPSTTLTTEPSTDATTVPPTTEPLSVPCTGLSLTETSILLKEIGATWLLDVVPTPADTTDEIHFESSNPDVATVSADGRITAVGDGTCTITITCGSATVQCEVECDIPEETEPTTEPEETEPQIVFEFNTPYGDEVTLSVGELWLAYVGEIDKSEIQWSVGNTGVATVVNGTVTARGVGKTTLRAVYKGVEYTCIVRVVAN